MQISRIERAELASENVIKEVNPFTMAIISKTQRQISPTAQQASQILCASYIVYIDKDMARVRKVGAIPIKPMRIL